MAKKKKNRNKKTAKKRDWFQALVLPEGIKRYILGFFFLLLAVIFTLSFFEKAGVAGNALFKTFYLLVGKTIFLFPLILVLTSLVFFLSKYKKTLGPLVLAILILVFGISGILEHLEPEIKNGGLLGYFINWPLSKLFGLWISRIIFTILSLAGGFIFWYLLKSPLPKVAVPEVKKKPSLIKKIFTPSFKVKELEPEKPEPSQKEKILVSDKKIKEVPQKKFIPQYQLPPIDLLTLKKGQPSAGDVRINSSVIKKTLESFDIPVEMSEVNIGPTVTQYTLKPADGIKLSKITSLSNDLALALASHPIRIEAPIPGKSLVGVEVPNKVRAFVRLKELISSPQFQKSYSNLTFCLGKEVSGNFVYADLSKMPHLLVAGATGAGKTIFLNSLILSLLYKNSPQILRFILIDPKRVEFPVYNELPHLLCPVIFNASKTVLAFQWLTEEMERRFGILAEVGSRDIFSYNEQALENGNLPMPFIVVIVDELADLMAAKGREVEAGIVRLAQMARAVGIHLVVATQRPSVEVITGLIKANITSRVTFQVASQVDSRTVLDTAGAERLLGLGDMLFISAEVVKPKRLQGAYVAEKEVKKVVNWIGDNVQKETQKEKGTDLKEDLFKNELSEDLIETLKQVDKGDKPLTFEEKEEPLYEEAKKIVIESKKASASLLQRKLRIGYARAARLIDMLEERGVVGPSKGAKPREVYFGQKGKEYSEVEDESREDDEGWYGV